MNIPDTQRHIANHAVLSGMLIFNFCTESGSAYTVVERYFNHTYANDERLSVGRYYSHIGYYLKSFRPLLIAFGKYTLSFILPKRISAPRRSSSPLRNSLHRR